MRLYYDEYRRTIYYKRLAAAREYEMIICLEGLMDMASVYGLIDFHTAYARNLVYMRMSELGIDKTKFEKQLALLKFGKVDEYEPISYIEEKDGFILIKHQLQLTHDYDKKVFVRLPEEKKMGELYTEQIFIEDLNTCVLTFQETDYPLSDFLTDYGAPIALGSYKGRGKANEKKKAAETKRLSSNATKLLIGTPKPVTTEQPAQEHTGKNTNKILGLLKARKDNPVRDELMQALNDKYKERTPQVIEAMCEYKNFEAIKASCDRQSYPNKRKDAILKRAQAIASGLNFEGYSDPYEAAKRMKRDWAQEDEQ